MCGIIVSSVQEIAGSEGVSRTLSRLETKWTTGTDSRWGNAG